MRRFFGSVLAIVFAAGLPLAALASGSNQKIGDLELQRWISAAKFPALCSEANVAVNQMRGSRTTDPAKLHQMITAFSQCGTGPGQRYAGIYNLSVLTSGAAALLAARHEPPAPALQDAQFAHKAAQIILNYQTNPGARGGVSGLPSQLSTEAYRISQDAKSLIAYLEAPPAGAGMAQPGAMATASH